MASIVIQTMRTSELSHHTVDSVIELNSLVYVTGLTRLRNSYRDPLRADTLLCNI